MKEDKFKICPFCKSKIPASSDECPICHRVIVERPFVVWVDNSDKNQKTNNHNEEKQSESLKYTKK